MEATLITTLTYEINISLDEAEKIWKKVGHQFKKVANQLLESAENIRTVIPGFPYWENGKPHVADFVALVLDIRESTKHLIEAISSRTSKASQIERVLYETTAIFTAGSIITKYQKGRITEFLGDGFLALFKVENDAHPIEVYSAHTAAKNCTSATQEVVNSILYNRYQLHH